MLYIQYIVCTLYSTYSYIYHLYYCSQDHQHNPQLAQVSEQPSFIQFMNSPIYSIFVLSSFCLLLSCDDLCPDRWVFLYICYTILGAVDCHRSRISMRIAEYPLHLEFRYSEPFLPIFRFQHPSTANILFGLKQVMDIKRF